MEGIRVHDKIDDDLNGLIHSFLASLPDRLRLDEIICLSLENPQLAEERLAEVRKQVSRARDVAAALNRVASERLLVIREDTEVEESPLQLS